MAAQDIARALQRAESVLQRKPSLGLHEDAPATARWDGDLRVVASHANGDAVITDMPPELGGAGQRVTPGWLFRAGIASCVTTRIAMAAAAAGIELRALEVVASSQSDARGIFAMTATDGTPVPAGPREVHLTVRISAPGVSTERRRSMVQMCNHCSPMSHAVQAAVPIVLHVETDAG